MQPHLRLLPIGRTGDPPPWATALVAAGRKGHTRAVSVGPAADGAMGISLWEDGAGTYLWKETAALDKAGAYLVASAPQKLLCFLPGHGIFEVDGKRLGVRMFADASVALPERVFAVGDPPVSVFAGENGGWLFAAVMIDAPGADGRLFGPAIEGPMLEPRQALSLAAFDDRGRLLVAADDAELGFQLWRREQNGWSLLVKDGAARRAFNPALHDACFWGGSLTLSAGLSSVERRRLFGLSLPGEILLLEQSGRVQIVCGEMRPSENGLLAPLIGAKSAAARETGTFDHLAASEDLLVAALQRHDGSAAIYGFTNDFRTLAFGEFRGTVHGLFLRDSVITAIVADTAF